MATHYSEGFHQDVVEKKVLHFQCLLCFWVQIKTLIYKTQTHTDKANMATKFVNANVATLYSKGFHQEVAEKKQVSCSMLIMLQKTTNKQWQTDNLMMHNVYKYSMQFCWGEFFIYFFNRP